MVSVECQFLVDGLCSLIAKHGWLPPRLCQADPKACAVCQKTDTPRTGECNSVIASLSITRSKRDNHELADQIREKLHHHCLVRPQGPGTWLMRILHFFRLFGKKGCKCAHRAAQMNSWGCDKCLEELDTIVGWLREEAEKRELPFVERGARTIVKLAIRCARKGERLEKNNRCG